MGGCTLAGMGKLRSVPGWVKRPMLVVAGTEDFLLWVFGQTGSPEVLGSRLSLAWLGRLDDQTSPMIHCAAEPIESRALAEFMIASSISTGDGYPPPEWWSERRVVPDDVPSRGFWDAHAGYESTRSFARGVSVALGWAFGVIDDPAHMTPVFREDGSTLSEQERDGCAQVLRTLSVQPLPAPARPKLAARPAGRGSWIA